MKLASAFYAGPFCHVQYRQGQQGWDFDALGNFDTQTTDGTPQTRTHNKQNQSTVVGGNNLTFDSNGKTTKDETGKTYSFDAFNRLVLAKDSGGSTIATYSFDALGRRIVETVSGTTRDIFFSPGWQVVEEQIAGSAKTQYVWSPVYIDAMIARDRDADGNGSLEERLYAQQDANFNVTFIINTSGSVVERYAYDPYGTPTFLNASWTSIASSAYSWTTLHQGGRHEPLTGLYLFRHRDYSPTLGRWLEVDPIGYASGEASLYRTARNNPAVFKDPQGLDPYGWTFCPTDIWNYPKSFIGGQYKATLEFRGFASDKQRDHLREAFKVASLKLHKAYYVLKEQWDQIEANSDRENLPNRRTYELLRDNRARYEERLRILYEALRSEDTVIVLDYRPGGPLWSGSGETRLWTNYWGWYWNLWTGNIQVADRFFVYGDDWDAYHELARLYFMLNDYGDDNIHQWDWIVQYLSRKYDELNPTEGK